MIFLDGLSLDPNQKKRWRRTTQTVRNKFYRRKEVSQTINTCDVLNFNFLEKRESESELLFVFTSSLSFSSMQVKKIYFFIYVAVTFGLTICFRVSSSFVPPFRPIKIVV